MRRQAVGAARARQAGEEALAELPLVGRIASQPIESTYSTAATNPASSSCGSVPVSKRCPSGSFAAGRTLYGRQRSSSSRRAKPRPEMRPVELVRRADEDVDARRRHVDRPVRRVVDGVDPGERAHLMRELGDARDVDQRPDRVRGPREGDHARALRKQRGRGGRGRAVHSSSDLGEPDFEAEVVRELEPGRDVPVVVEPRHDDLVAARELPADRAREREVERRHVGAEDDLLRRQPRNSAPVRRASSMSASVMRLVSYGPPTFAFDSRR